MGGVEGRVSLISVVGVVLTVPVGSRREEGRDWSEQGGVEDLRHGPREGVEGLRHGPREKSGLLPRNKGGSGRSPSRTEEGV